MAKYRIFPRGKLFRKRSILSITAGKRAAARRKINRRVAEKYDPFAITLGLITTIGLLFGNAALIFTGGVSFTGYMLIKHRSGNRSNVVKPNKPGIIETDDQKVLREWDEHVKNSGGYNREGWIKAMRDRRDN
ncbi:hypothetical protein FPX60_06450 [Salmonella enterica]|nr:hypothetical protein [Salmonella enterica]EEN3300478.1 hypothetical protein [Salmonella enterica]